MKCNIIVMRERVWELIFKLYKFTMSQNIDF